jgi:hypothetical protein
MAALARRCLVFAWIISVILGESALDCGIRFVFTFAGAFCVGGAVAAFARAFAERRSAKL